MELIQHWAGISFSAQNGDPEGLLTAAAAGSLPLSDVVPRPGGFSARCAAWHYRKLAALARKRRVRLRIQKRCGLFFRLRPLFRRRGLWTGCLVFLPLLLWLQGFVWFIEPVGLTPGQQARAAVVLWEAGLSRECRYAGQTHSRRIRSAPERRVLLGKPQLYKRKAGGRSSGRKACARHCCRNASRSPCQSVRHCGKHEPCQRHDAGRPRAGSRSRSGPHRDCPCRTGRNAHFQPAAGIVRAQFEWEDEQEAALTLPTEQLTGRQTVRRELFWNGQSIALSSLHPVPTASEAKAVIRHDQPEAFGIPFPCFIEETSYYYKEVVDLERTEEQALAIARLQSKQALQTNWPDFELLARKEDVSVEESTLHYRVVYTIVANICK